MTDNFLNWCIISHWLIISNKKRCFLRWCEEVYEFFIPFPFVFFSWQFVSRYLLPSLSLQDCHCLPINLVLKQFRVTLKICITCIGKWIILSSNESVWEWNEFEIRMQILAYQIEIVVACCIIKKYPNAINLSYGKAIIKSMRYWDLYYHC